MQGRLRNCSSQKNTEKTGHLNAMLECKLGPLAIKNINENWQNLNEPRISDGRNESVLVVNVPVFTAVLQS